MTDVTILDIEDQILINLIYNEEYMRKVIPFLQEDYFTERHHQVIYNAVDNFVDKYGNLPTKEALIIDIDDTAKLGADSFEEVVLALEEFYSRKDQSNNNLDWLVERTEQFCQDRALFNAMADSLQIIQTDDTVQNSNSLRKTAIPEMLQDALAVSFDNSIGHDFMEDAEARFEKIHEKEDKIPFDIEMLNKITKGGVAKKTLNIIMGGTGGFKTGTLCHFASSYIRQGYNVLYITLEMAEERIAERIDCNILDVDMDSLKDMPRKMFVDRIDKAKKKVPGKLIVKEYPTASAHAGHFRFLMKELIIKKGFKPDIVIIDYLNICTSSRIKGGSENSYLLVKNIAEEIRGLGVEMDVPIWSATQTNRGGFGSTDVELTDTSESWGLPATADLFLVVIGNEELDKLGQLMFKQLKNRYNDLNFWRRFMVGANKAKMTLFDLADSAQDNLVQKSASASSTATADSKAKKDAFASFKF